MKEFLIAEADIGTRLDKVVAAAYPEFTRSSLELLFDKEFISVNGRVAKPSHKVHAADEISVDESYLNQKPAAIDLPIIYEDNDVILVDKPSGILTHTKGALNFEPTVASFIQNKITDKSLAGNRAGIAHRLDRGTSGVIITAKTQAAMHWLQKQFSQRKTKKTYIAVVEGAPDPPEAIIEAPMSRSPKKPQTFAVMPGGKPASTRYKVLKEFSKDGKTYSKLELKPLTGRTHQLRVHLAYIGHPIVGDPIYGHGGGQMLLHALSLELTMPDKKRQIFRSPLPQSFKEFTTNDK